MSALPDRADIVIVGGGHNGLTAAAYLAAAGKSVVLLERLDGFGGAAVSAPAFPGVDAQKQALQHGVKISGATVHLVTAELDNGPIVLQAAVPVRADDTAETLSARILIEEHRLYPEAVRTILDGGWSIDGRRFVTAPPAR